MKTLYHSAWQYLSSSVGAALWEQYFAGKACILQFIQLFMKIGFDAKRAFHNTTGLGHYSRTLLRSLAEYFPENQYWLYNPKPSAFFNTSAFPNIKERLPATAFGRFLPSWWRTNGITPQLQQDGIELYHGLSHEIPLGIRKTGIPSVVTMHDLIFERYPKQYPFIDRFSYRRKFKYACSHADLVIAISEQTKSDLINYYHTPAEKIRVCYQSCNAAFFAAGDIPAATLERVRMQYQLPPEYYLSVGSIIERKNLLAVCEAIHINRSHIDIPLVVIGTGGAYKQQVMDYVKQKDLSKLIIFLSDTPAACASATFKDATDFPAIYRMAKMMVYPSLFEGFGIPILEAMAAGIPVVTSNTSCMPETGGNAALYINPLDSEELAHAIRQVLTNPATASEMVIKGHQQVLHFTAANTALEVMKVYRELYGH
jgi:glycosyltransferase involved in cell wall biosynthesis